MKEKESKLQIEAKKERGMKKNQNAEAMKEKKRRKKTPWHALSATESKKSKSEKRTKKLKEE